MIVEELFGTKIINASILFANSNISVKYYSKDFPSVNIFLKDFSLYLSYIIAEFLNFRFKQHVSICKECLNM